ncbi:hypothetical protein CJU76_11000 [Pseudomonas fragi]|nr:hypothetical protein CJU76_11000 [Pseudomonas fragi]
MPRRTAFAALRFPRSGPAPWARRHGPSLAHRGSPGIHAGRPTPQNLLSASRRGGQIKSTASRGGRPAGLFGSRVLRNLCRYSVAGQALFVGASLLANDLREQARSHSCSVPRQRLQKLQAHVFSGFFSQVCQLLGRGDDAYSRSSPIRRAGLATCLTFS